MSGGRRGLDVVNDVIISVDNINDEQLYTMHKQHKPPYMDPHMKSRFIWVHKTKGYVSWLVSGKTLIVHESDVPQG